MSSEGSKVGVGEVRSVSPVFEKKDFVFIVVKWRKEFRVDTEE